MTTSSGISQQPPAVARPSMLPWAVSCAFAEAIGMTAAAGAARTSQDVVGDHPSVLATVAALLLVVAGGLVEGCALGSAQTYAGRPWLPHLAGRRWVGVTMAVAGIGWALGAAPAVFAGDSENASAGPPRALVVAGALGLGAVMGVALGAGQAWVLRGAVPHPARWVAANALAWPPTMLLIFVGAALPSENWRIGSVLLLGAVTGLLAGAVLGLVTGWFLPSLSGPPPHNRVVASILHSRWHPMLSRGLVLLRVRGRRTGRWYELPVMFAEDPAGFVVLPGHPESKTWWRNLRIEAEVQIYWRGLWYDGTASVLKTGDEGYEDAAATFRTRWPRVDLPTTALLVRAAVNRAEPNQR